MKRKEKNMKEIERGAILSACSGPADRTEITETAQRSEYRPEDQSNATSERRFGSSKSSTPVSQASAESQAEKPFHYDVPAGWTELPPTRFRNPNFAVGLDGDMECYISVLSGDGGGILINANRWRGQFNVDPYTEEEADNLPGVTIMGHSAKVLNFVGEFKGMGATEAKANYRLIGAIIQAPDSLITIKMTGPADKVLLQLNQFASLIDSLHINDGHSHDVQTAAAAPIADDATMPPDHPDIVSAPITTSPAPNGVGDYIWEVPEGWAKSSAGSSMRLITFAIGDTPGEEAECYIVVLGGDGGGRLSNYNRWLGQFGQEPIQESELMLQPPVIFLDDKVPILACEGRSSGMGSAWR